MKYPSISCLCPTFNRAPTYLHLLEEAVEAWRRCAMLYPGESELVILNDCPQQVLACQLPGVRIYNTQQRYPTLGQKRNALCELARYEVLAPWDDDDISLPYRLNDSNRALQDALGVGRGYVKPGGYWYLNGDSLHHDHGIGVGHNCSLFTFEAWEDVGGYPSVSGNEDLQIDQNFSIADHTHIVRQEPATWWYVYCWGRCHRHLSGRG